MAEEAKQDVAPPAPEPTEDVADEKAAVPSPEESKALVVAESTLIDACCMVSGGELHGQVRGANPFSCFSPSDDAEKPAATGGSHERGTGSSSSKSEINHIFWQL